MNGAVVDDLQLSPAVCLYLSSPISAALQLAFEREFDIIPVITSTKQLLGYVTADTLRKEMESGASEDKTITDLSSSFKRFQRNKEFQIITPMTELEELNQFFSKSGASFAIVSDAERKFVLGVVTNEDLQKFIKRRNPNGV